MNVHYKRSILFILLLSPLLANAEDLLDLSLEDLLNIEVTSVSKQSQPLSNAPAAIYVISSDDIQSSGVTSIPQALRDVPGLHVAQIDSQKWAVSSRGFNGRYNNKLLVMMDGRTLYSPEFSGVYWEVQDTLMADIERIEVIRGPSAAMWGANAVNGVINITTKHSADTLGGYAELGLGDYEHGFTGFRYGGQLAENVTARGYAKGFKRDSLEHNAQDMDPSLHMTMMGLNTDNDWHQLQAGSRIDIDFDSTASLTLSTDIYDSKMQQIYQVAQLTAPYRDFIHDSFDSRGWNVLTKYTKALSATSELSFQAYYDYVRRDEDLFGFTTDTVDFEFQHQFIAWQKHSFIWGMGYRHIKDDIATHPTISSSKDLSTHTNLWSAFIRDEITLLDNQLWLTLASRFEHNSYTDFEAQPNIRLMWQLNEHHKLWSSIAYAVRTPNRAENNLIVNPINIPAAPPTVLQISLMGNDHFESEELLSYEMGYRFTPSSKLSFDTAIFYNDYDKLRGVTNGTPDPSGFPIITVENLFCNNQDGQNYGFELSSQWVASDALKFKFNYSYIHSDFNNSNPAQNTDSPEKMLSAHADWDIASTLNLNLTWRYVDAAPVLGTFNATTNKVLDSYQGLDIGLSWQLTPDLTLAAYGKNLLYPGHVEYEPEQFHIPHRVEPSFYAKVSVSF